jgi:hypothetical protein
MFIEMDKERFVAIFMAFLSCSQVAFLKWRQGLLYSSLWLGWERVIMNLVCSLGGKGLWKERSYLFGEEFRRYVENDLMKQLRTRRRNRLARSASEGITVTC